VKKEEKEKKGWGQTIVSRMAFPPEAKVSITKKGGF
jgi:hypothetical protein